MPDVEALQKSVQSVLDSMRSYVETASDLAWTPSDGFLPVVRRAILRRQFDSLNVISHLVAEKKGYASAPLLRPACEELIWIKYLDGIGPQAAEELVGCVANRELLDSLRAQDEYAGRTVSKDLGLLRHIENASVRDAAVCAHLRTLGTKLGWPDQNGQLPSMSWLAKKTGQQKTYKFLYHATSRFVHFSAAELLRRAWSTTGGKVSVRSIHFHDYWAAFALQWGLRLFVESAIVLCAAPGMPKGFDEIELPSAAERIKEFGQAPIITAEELAWPE